MSVVEHVYVLLKYSTQRKHDSLGKLSILTCQQRRRLLSATPYCCLTWTGHSSQCTLRTLPPYANQPLVPTNNSKWDGGTLGCRFIFHLCTLTHFLRFFFWRAHTNKHAIKRNSIPYNPVIKWKHMITRWAHNNTRDLARCKISTAKRLL